MPARPTSIRTARTTLVAALAIIAVSCGREPSGPPLAAEGATMVSGPLGWNTIFPAGVRELQMAAQNAPGGAGDIVTFTKVRIVLNNPDGSVALDIVVDFPSGATEVPVTLTVPLPANTPPGGLPLALNLKYMNAAGETVFSGGPVTVNAVPTTPGSPPPPASQVNVNLSYTGPGATASTVRITPTALTVLTGQPFAFEAVALDASGTVIPNTPIVFNSTLPLLAAINNATGAGMAGLNRGVVPIQAQLLTGPTAIAQLTIVSPPARLAAVSGSGQNGAVGGVLANPVIVAVTAEDGGPAAGVTVTFAARNGGSVGAATVTTDANGRAQTTWRLGAGAGPQSLTAAAAGLAGSPVDFTATARSVDPVSVRIATQPPATTEAGVAFGVVVNVLDAQGDIASRFTGPVSLAIASGPPGTAIVGGATVNAVAGVATFTGLRLNVAGTYTLIATSQGLRDETSTSMRVVAGPASRLAFQGYPVSGVRAGDIVDEVSVDARDAFNNVATSFVGTVTLHVDELGALVGGTALRSPASAASRAAIAAGDPATATAIAGVARFGGLRLFTAGSVAFRASAPGLTSTTGPRFGVIPGSPGSLLVAGGTGQQGNAGAPLSESVSVQLADAFGNPIRLAGRPVTFTAANGGSANPSTTSTNAAGIASTTWTLGPTAGAQSLTATSSGLTSDPIRATALEGGAGATAGDFIMIHDVNWLDPTYGINASHPGNAQFLRNLVNFTITGPRAAANKVLLFDFGTLNFYTFTGNWAGAKTVIESQGYVTEQTTTRSVLSAIPSNVKMLILHAPSGTFSIAEVNALKAFIAQGGRILYIGENSGFQYTLTAANLLVGQMGGSTTSTGSCAFGTTTANSHPLTTGIAVSGSTAFHVACASIMNTGTGDVVLMHFSGNPVVVIVKVNTIPLVAPLHAEREPSAAAAIRQVAPESGFDRTLGPTGRKPPQQPHQP